MNEKLETYLRICNQAYVEGTPIITDEVYDRLVENTFLFSTLTVYFMG